MARKDSDNQKKSMSRLFRGRARFKPLNTGRIDGRVSCVREWVANIFFYTKNGVTIMIDAGYNYAGLCRIYNLDLPDVIAVRNEFLPEGGRVENIIADWKRFDECAKWHI